MSTQMEYAQKGIITPQMEQVAGVELQPVSWIAGGVAAGTIVIPANINHRNLIPCGIGRELKTKVNGNSALSAAGAHCWRRGCRKIKRKIPFTSALMRSWRSVKNTM